MVKINEGVLKTRISRKVYIPYYAMVLAILILFGILYLSEVSVTHVQLIVAIVFIIIILKITEVHRFGLLYEINPDSLVQTIGILNKKIKRVDYFAISDLDITQNFWQRIWGYGNVNVRLFSKDSTTTIENVNSPKKIAEFLEDSIAVKRKGGKKSRTV